LISFQNCFRYFVLIPNLVEEFEFSQVKITEYISDAISYCGFQVNVEDVLFDMVESVCLIQLEGHFYSFVHRSFQEYFTAVFLEKCSENFRNEFLNDFILRPWDTVLPMLFDMSQDRIEVGWVLPQISEYISNIENMKSTLSRSVFSQIWATAKIGLLKSNKGMFHSLEPGTFRKRLQVLKAFYPERFTELSSYIFTEDIDEFAEQICNELKIEYMPMSSEVRMKMNSSTKFEEIDFRTDRQFPIKNAFIRKTMEDYKAVLAIKEAVGDHKIIQQKFLSKIKQRNGGGDIYN
jgi:hypothetical protein